MFNTAVTLVCNPAAPCLDEAAAETLNILESYGACRRRTLAAGIAEDFTLTTAIDSRALQTVLAGAFSNRGVDIIVQPVQNRRKRLLIADMDSTIIEQECIDELADFTGRKTEIAAITERAMRGQLEFEAALVERVEMLKGLPQNALEETFKTRITLTPGARTLVRTMRAHGATTVLVSGGFAYFVERVAALAGFQHHRANALLIEGGKLTGAVARPILGRAAKAAALVRFAKEAGVAPAETLAVGDGANDLSMIARAGLGVAFRAKPKVAEAAHASIRHADLTALLYAQGYAAEDFVN